MTFKKGEKVKILCKAEPGPFDDVAITISSGTGVVSGFVNKALVERRGDKAFVLGKIVKVDNGTIEVQLPGSFFTSARGLASLPRAWADSNMEHA